MARRSLPSLGRTRRARFAWPRSGRLPLVALLVLVTAAAARLHTELRSSLPAAGETVSQPVAEVLLTFTTPVNRALSRIEVTDPEGSPVATGELEHPPEREDQLRVVFGTPVGAGAYEVEWQAMSPDGHVVRGTFAFQVDSPPGPEEAAPPTPAPPSAPPAQAPGAQPPPSDRVEESRTSNLPTGTGTRWLQLLGSTLLLGVVGFRFGVIPVLAQKGGLPELRTRIRRGLWRFGWIGVALYFAALPLRLAHQTAELGPGLDPGQLGALLFQTAWGAGWFLHLLVGTLAIVGLILSAPRGLGDRGWSILAGAMVLLPLVPALQGHAWGGDHHSRALAVASLYAHVAGAGLWLGGLILLVLVGLPAVRSTPATAEELAENSKKAVPPLFRLVNAFSRLALPAIALLLLTGVINSWLMVGGPQNLFGTAYGRTLLIKLGAIAGVLVLGFYNWRRVRPGLREKPDAGALRIPATVEAVLGIVVLLVTAALVATPPP